MEDGTQGEGTRGSFETLRKEVGDEEGALTKL